MWGGEFSNSTYELEDESLGTSENLGVVAYGPFFGWYSGGEWRAHFTYFLKSLMKSAATNTVYYGNGFKVGGSFRLLHPIRFIAEFSYYKYEEQRNSGEDEPTKLNGDSQIRVTQLLIGVSILLW